MDAIAARLNSPDGIGPHREALITVATKIEELSPGATALLSRADLHTLDELRSAEPESSVIRHHLAQRWQLHPNGILPRQWWLAFHDQAPFRTFRNMTS